MLRFFKIWFAVLTGSNLEFSTLKLISHSNLIAQLACSVFFLTCSSSWFFFSWRNIKMTFITAHIWFRIGPRVSLFSFSDGLKWQCSLLLCHGTYKGDRDSHLKKSFTLLYLCVYACACTHVWENVLEWRLEDNLWELVLSFCYMGPWDQTQDITSGGKLLYMLHHFTGPEINYIDILWFLHHYLHNVMVLRVQSLSRTDTLSIPIEFGHLIP